MINNRGYTIVLDALLALIITIILFAGLWGSLYFKSSDTAPMSFKILHYISEDTLDVLNKNGVLDEVGAAWADSAGDNTSANWSYAANLSHQYIESLIPPHIGYRFYVEDDVLAENTTRSDESSATAETHSLRLLVGYGSGLPTRGDVARLYLTNIKSKTNSRYVYFGGFVGEGNITTNLTLPSDMDSVLQAYIELNAPSPFQLLINGVSAGNITPSGSGMTANVKSYIPNPKTFFQAGDNSIEIRFSGSDLSRQYVGGGFVKVTYNTSSMESSIDVGEFTFYFPRIQGLVNYYSSVYVPGVLQNMSIHLHVKSNYSTYLTVGDTVVYNQSLSGSEISVTLDDENLSETLSYAELSQQTVPIRLGLQNLSVEAERGNADVILTTDISFSMWTDRCMDGTWRMVYDKNNPALNDTAIAKQLCTSQCVRNDGLMCHYPDYWTGHPECVNCYYGCWRSFGCGQNPSAACSVPCYECVWYGRRGNYSEGHPGGGSYCYDCTNLGCQYCFDTSEVGQWCTLSCSPTLYAYWGVNGTAANKTAPPPAGQCSLYTCSSYARESCSFYGYHSCDQAYVHQHTTYDIDGLPIIWYLPCPNQCIACDLTGIGLAKQIDADFTNRILNVSGNRVGLVSYGDATYATTVLSNNTGTLITTVNSYLAGGETCICCAINSAISLLSGSNVSRLKFIVAMTDGEANVRCGNAFSDLDGDSQITAKDDAIQSACTAREANNITVYSVGFGSAAGQDTLQRIASCGNGSYYMSNNSDELSAIYRDIANDIIDAVYVAQAINASFVYESILYSDSRIDFRYAPVNATGYGEITVSSNTERFNNTVNCSGFLYTPSGTFFTDAQATSYSGDYWTDYAAAGNASSLSTAYTLRDGHFGADYTLLGDPFTVNIPLSFLTSGVNNTLKVETGLNITNHTGCSEDNRVIYTVKLPRLVGYGDVFQESLGCRWTIEFEDGSIMNAAIPKSYNGTNLCYYTSVNATGAYPSSDSYADAVARLLRQLDLDSDGRVDILFDETMIQFELARAGGVRSLWGPVTAKLVLWM